MLTILSIRGGAGILVFIMTLSARLSMSDRHFMLLLATATASVVCGVIIMKSSAVVFVTTVCAVDDTSFPVTVRAALDIGYERC